MQKKSLYILPQPLIVPAYIFVTKVKHSDFKTIPGTRSEQNFRSGENKGTPTLKEHKAHFPATIAVPHPVPFLLDDEQHYFILFSFKIIKQNKYILQIFSVFSIKSICK